MPQQAQGDWVDVPSATGSQGDWVDVSSSPDPQPKAPTPPPTFGASPKTPPLVSFDPKKIISPVPGGGIGGSPVGNPLSVNTSSIENYTQEGRKEHPVLSRVGDVTSGLKELFEGGQAAGKPLGTSSGVFNNPVTTAMSLAPGAAEGAAAATNAASEAMKSGESLARINKILGVGAREVRVGQVPESLDEFASNPARGVVKAGIDEKKLAKMNPVERLKAVTETRNASGAKLDKVLEANADKKIDVAKVAGDVFKEIPDPKLLKTATTRWQQIISKAGIDPTKSLSQLTPLEARTVQRELDQFADFAPEGSAQTFRNVATQLRRGISQATRKAIPETAELDQDYGDLAGATSAARRQANKYARTVPVGKMRKMLPYLAGAAAGGGAAGYLAKQILPSAPQ